MNTNEKLEEIEFFLELLYALEKRGQSLSNEFTIEQEASFLFSAILNGFYSATELAKDGGNKSNDVQNFKNNHPVIYANAKNNGLRNTTVHVKHVGIDHSGYIAPEGNKVNLNFKKLPKLVREQANPKEIVDLNLTPYFYIELNGQPHRVMELADNHYYELKKFISMQPVV